MSEYQIEALHGSYIRLEDEAFCDRCCNRKPITDCVLWYSHACKLWVSACFECFIKQAVEYAPTKELMQKDQGFVKIEKSCENCKYKDWHRQLTPCYDCKLNPKVESHWKW